MWGTGGLLGTVAMEAAASRRGLWIKVNILRGLQGRQSLLGLLAVLAARFSTLQVYFSKAKTFPNPSLLITVLAITLKQSLLGRQENS